MAIKRYLLLASLALTACDKPAPSTQFDCAQPVTGCQIDDLQLKFDQTPHVLLPFKLEIKQAQAKQIYVSVGMPGMEMGLNRYRLQATAADSWQAEITLPVCIQGRADWRMRIELDPEQHGRIYEMGFTSLHSNGQ